MQNDNYLRILYQKLDIPKSKNIKVLKIEKLEQGKGKRKKKKIFLFQKKVKV